MAIRQNSSSGKQKSPRIQVVLPEELCAKLTLLAEKESRTVSNMAKVLIQEGIQGFESKGISTIKTTNSLESTEKVISALEAQHRLRLRGTPRKFKLYKP